MIIGSENEIKLLKLYANSTLVIESGATLIIFGELESQLNSTISNFGQIIINE